MRFRIDGDPPSWLVVAWLAVMLSWVIVPRVVERRRSARVATTRPPLAAPASGWSASPFALTVHERSIVGVHHRASAVSFGPSGRQIAGAVVVPCASFGLVGVAASLGAGDATRWSLLAVAAGATAWSVSALRVRVDVTPDGMAWRGRVGPAERARWAEVEDVRRELEPVHVQVHGPQASAVVGVVQVVRRAPRRLPGFRSTSWHVEGGQDTLTVVDQKVAIIRRYRDQVVGPWPSGGGSGGLAPT